MEYTTIKISKQTRKFMDGLKVHPRQSYEEILNLITIHIEKAIKQGDFKILNNWPS